MGASQVRSPYERHWGMKNVYSPKMYFVPAVLRINCSGISRRKQYVASKPVQCVGTIQSGAMAFVSATVCSMAPQGESIRWKPPMTA